MAMAVEGDEGPELAAPWPEVLARFDRDLKARGSAANTRRAYGVDLRAVRGLGDGARARAGLDHLPRAAHATRRRSRSAAWRASSVARKLAAVRSLYAHLVAIERGGSESRRAAPEPEAGVAAAARARPRRDRALLDRIPAGTRSSYATGRCSSWPTRAGCAASEIVQLDAGDPDFDSEVLRVTGKGEKTRLVPIGEPAQRALDRYLTAARPSLEIGPRRPRRCSCLAAAAGSRRPTFDAAWSAGCGRRRWRAESPRTRCATRSPPTCSRAAPTCARSRSCSVTRASRRPRSTRALSPSRLRREYARAHPRA